MKGVIWYQGENNAARANEYIDLFPALITDWRSRWNNEFPFLLGSISKLHVSGQAAL